MLTDKSIRVALLHFSPSFDNVWHNVELLEKLIFKAKEFRPDIIVTPELAVCGYEFNKVLGKEWIKAKSAKIIARFSRLARQNKLALVLGCPVYDEKSEKYFNAALLIDEQGNVIGMHCKINVLPGSEGWSSPGTEIKVATWRKQKIGLLICSDAYTENIAAELEQQGANVLISPAAWAPGLHGPDGEWERRSEETGLCLLVCNRTGKEAVLNFEGSCSTIVTGGHRRVEYAEKEPAILGIEVDSRTWFPRSDRFTILGSTHSTTSLPTTDDGK